MLDLLTIKALSVRCSACSVCPEKNYSTVFVLSTHTASSNYHNIIGTAGDCPRGLASLIPSCVIRRTQSHDSRMRVAYLQTTLVDTVIPPQASNLCRAAKTPISSLAMLRDAAEGPTWPAIGPDFGHSLTALIRTGNRRHMVALVVTQRCSQRYVLARICS